MRTDSSQQTLAAQTGLKSVTRRQLEKAFYNFTITLYGGRSSVPMDRSTTRTLENPKNMNEAQYKKYIL